MLEERGGGVGWGSLGVWEIGILQRARQAACGYVDMSDMKEHEIGSCDTQKNVLYYARVLCTGGRFFFSLPFDCLVTYISWFRIT